MIFEYMIYVCCYCNVLLFIYLFTFVIDCSEEDILVTPEDSIIISDETKISSDDNKISLPMIKFHWIDESQNDRVSIILTLFSGTKENDIDAIVLKGGKQVELTYTWPEIMLSPKDLLSFYQDNKNNLLYSASHTKSVALGEEIKKIRGGVTDKKVTSSFLIDLPFEVEEQFYNTQFHPGLDLLTHGDHLLIHLEMMGKRTSYKVKFETPKFRSAKKARK